MALGTIIFYIIIGPNILNPSEINWLGRYDFLQSYLGWEFYRNAPWTLPIGSNPKLGHEIASSIVYSDSIPLFAIFFKIFNPILSSKFQYFGIWLFVCYLAQAYISWKIAELLTSSLYIKVLFCIFLTISPIVIWRLEMLHISLVAHFLILFALYLNLYEKNDLSGHWCSVLVIAVMIHFYLFFMVGVLWIANCLDRLVQKREVFTKINNQLIRNSVIVGIVAWSVGYFMVSLDSVSDKSYGSYPMNLMAPIDARGHSSLFNINKINKVQDEAFNYLGAGIIFLIVISLPGYFINIKIIKQNIFKRFFLVNVLFLLLIIAITNQIGFGNKAILISYPEWLIDILGIVRSSGRLFWPVYYFLIIITLWLVLKTYSRYYAYLFFTIALCIQIIDLSPLVKNTQLKLLKPLQEKNEEKLESPIWKIISENYENILSRPSSNVNNNWNIFSPFAAKHNMSTNIVTISRASNKNIIQSQKKFDEAIYENKLDYKSVYIINDIDKWKYSYKKSKIKINHTDDILLRVDNFNVLIPGWKKCKPCAEIQVSNYELNLAPPTINLKQRLLFNKASSNPELFLLNGWHHSSEKLTLLEGESGGIVFPIQMPYPKYLELEFSLNGSNGNLLKIEVLINGVQSIVRQIAKTDKTFIVIPIPNIAKIDGYIEIQIKPIYSNKRENYPKFGLVSATFN